MSEPPWVSWPRGARRSTSSTSSGAPTRRTPSWVRGPRSRTTGSIRSVVATTRTGSSRSRATAEPRPSTVPGTTVMGSGPTFTLTATPVRRTGESDVEAGAHRRVVWRFGRVDPVPLGRLDIHAGRRSARGGNAPDRGARRGARSAESDSPPTSGLGDSGTDPRTRKSPARHDGTGSNSVGPENMGPVIGPDLRDTRSEVSAHCPRVSAQSDRSNLLPDAPRTRFLAFQVRSRSSGTGTTTWARPNSSGLPWLTVYSASEALCKRPVPGRTRWEVDLSHLRGLANAAR